MVAGILGARHNGGTPSGDNGIVSASAQRWCGCRCARSGGWCACNGGGGRKDAKGPGQAKHLVRLVGSAAAFRAYAPINAAGAETVEGVAICRRVVGCDR